MRRPLHIIGVAAALAIGLGTLSTAASAAPALENHVIDDPAYGNMPAVQIRAPAGWQFEGSISRMCMGIPSPSEVATSPDGRYQFVLEPRLTWKWIDGMQMPQQGDCLPIQQALRAQDFLVHFVQSIGNRGPMKIIGSMPISDAYRQAAQDSYQKLSAQSARQNAMAPSYGGYVMVDTGAIRVQTQQGEERYRATVTCFMVRGTGLMGSHYPESCGAQIDITRAPQGHLDAFVSYVDANRR